MSLVEHLDDLRKRVIRCVILLTLAWTVAWIMHDPIYALINRTAKLGLPRDMKYTEAFLSVTDAFMLKLKLSFMFGLVVAAPFLVLQLWGFIAPGLKPSERKPFRVIGPLSVFLFGLGCYFCWLIIPTTISWFAGVAVASFDGAVVNQEPGRLVFFVLNMMLAFGAGFQLPLIVYFLAKIGLLPRESLLQYWRQAVVVIFIVSAVLTPSADPISMLMMAIPLCILFVLSVFAVRTTVKPDVDEEEPEPRMGAGALAMEPAEPPRAAIPFTPHAMQADGPTSESDVRWDADEVPMAGPRRDPSAQEEAPEDRTQP